MCEIMLRNMMIDDDNYFEIYNILPINSQVIILH